MAILPGHEDLKQREIIGFNGQGQALVADGDQLRAYRLFIGFNGGIKAEPVVVDNTPDQVGGQPKGDRVPVKDRWRGIDQTV